MSIYVSKKATEAEPVHVRESTPIDSRPQLSQERQGRAANLFRSGNHRLCNGDLKVHFTDIFTKYHWALGLSRFDNVIVCLQSTLFPSNYAS
jgi:hypothetical protein